MRRAVRMLLDTLALLVGLGPNDRALAVVLAVAGVITLDWFSSAVMRLFDEPATWDAKFWVGLLALPLVLIAFVIVTRRVWRRLDKKIEAVVTSKKPPPTRGLILFLSAFNTFAPKLPPQLRSAPWKAEDLVKAVDCARPDWPTVLDYAQASNMQPALEAIRYHCEAGALKHVWLVTTRDMLDANGNVARRGSHVTLPAFRRIVTEGLKWQGFTLHDCDENPRLRVAPYNAQEVFEAVDAIYREEAPKAGLAPEELTADITGGTVTMTSGMLLASVLFSRPVQYTAADHDPMQGRPLEQPTPFAIDVDELALRRLIFRHLAAEEGAAGGVRGAR